MRLLAACSRSSLLASAQTTKDTLVAALAAEGTVLDPARYSAGVDQYFIGQMFEQLVRFDPDLKPVNWLAESWKIEGTPDKPIIDVHIRKGVKFHNGDPLTSADFEFSFERLRDPKISRWTHLQANVEKFEIIDDHHFKLHFKAPDGDYIVGYAAALGDAEEVFREGRARTVSPRRRSAPGRGSSSRASIKEELKLEAFDDYWNKDARPKVKNLVIKIIPEDLTRVAAFKSGAVDWIDAVPLSAIDEIKKMPGVKTFTAMAPNNMYHRFPDLQAGIAVQQAEGAAGGGPRGRRRRDHQERAVRPGRALRRRSASGSTGYDPDLKPYPYDHAQGEAAADARPAIRTASRRPATT